MRPHKCDFSNNVLFLLMLIISVIFHLRDASKCVPKTQNIFKSYYPIDVNDFNSFLMVILCKTEVATMKYYTNFWTSDQNIKECL